MAVVHDLRFSRFVFDNSVDLQVAKSTPTACGPGCGGSLIFSGPAGTIERLCEAFVDSCAMHTEIEMPVRTGVNIDAAADLPPFGEVRCVTSGTYIVSSSIIVVFGAIESVSIDVESGHGCLFAMIRPDWYLDDRFPSEDGKRVIVTRQNGIPTQPPTCCYGC